METYSPHTGLIFINQKSEQITKRHETNLLRKTYGKLMVILLLRLNWDIGPSSSETYFWIKIKPWAWRLDNENYTTTHRCFAMPRYAFLVGFPVTISKPGILNWV